MNGTDSLLRHDTIGFGCMCCWRPYRLRVKLATVKNSEKMVSNRKVRRWWWETMLKNSVSVLRWCYVIVLTVVIIKLNVIRISTKKRSHSKASKTRCSSFLLFFWLGNALRIMRVDGIFISYKFLCSSNTYQSSLKRKEMTFQHIVSQTHTHCQRKHIRLSVAIDKKAFLCDV